MEVNEWPKKHSKRPKKESVIGDAKVHGEEHVNHVGKLVPKRVTGENCRCSKLQCFDQIDIAKREIILENFNKMSSKDDQDAHLCGLISIRLIARKRPRNADPDTRKDHAASFTYKVRIERKAISVCHKAFLSLHGISKNRVTRLQESLLTTGMSPKNQQGHHHSRPRKLPDVVINLVENHINSYQARKSHYSLRDNPQRRYLPEDLTIAGMHKHFLHLYQINIPYKSYWLIFNTFNIHFVYPRLDTCSVCDSLQQKINATEDETQKTRYTIDKKVHLKKAEAFRKEKKKFIIKAKKGEITCLSFDFMQNLPLPHIPSGPVFYSRQLWYNVFGVHGLADDSVIIYRYLEHEGKKGSNEVTSMLLDAINTLPDDKRHDELVLISDGCPGQNKNKTMIQFLYCLVHVLKLFTKITYLFPVRGHSYLPNDQDFVLIGNKKKNIKIVEIPEKWDELILNARKYPSPFRLKEMTHQHFFDIRKAVEPLLLKSPKPALKLKEVRMIMIDKNDRHVNARPSYFGSWGRHVVVNRTAMNENISTLNIPTLYQSPPGIQPAKKKDVLKLVQYLENPKHTQYYQTLFADLEPFSNDEENENNVEIDSDDNSDGCQD